MAEHTHQVIGKRFIKNGGMTRTTTYLIFTLLLSGCAANPRSESGAGPEVSRIRIDSTSKQQDGSPEMISRCSGFMLTEKQVGDFLQHATLIKEQVQEKYYRILPCSARGSVRLNRQKYSWVIRAGGVGEFYNDKERFFAVCGKNCCAKVPGIC
jgi:hypothetical protein